MLKTKQPVRIQYNTKDQYKRDAKMLGLMDDFKVFTDILYLIFFFLIQMIFRVVFQEQGTMVSYLFTTTTREFI